MVLQFFQDRVAEVEMAEIAVVQVGVQEEEEVDMAGGMDMFGGEGGGDDY